MDTTEKETLTVEDLDRVFIRVQDEDGTWHSRHVGEVTDKQFNSWAKSRGLILYENCKENEPWSPEERAGYCDFLWQHDALVILTKEARDEFRSVGTP